ncbi:IS701 family transposase, partial [Geobacillus stearothermophilus]|nr:IS701 family transposase [Geobacillus stearothermophilus]
AESRQHLSAGLELLRSRKGHSVVEFIYDAAKQGIHIDVIKKQLRIA